MFHCCDVEHFDFKISHLSSSHYIISNTTCSPSFGAFSPPDIRGVLYLPVLALLTKDGSDNAQCTMFTWLLLFLLHPCTTGVQW